MALFNDKGSKKLFQIAMITSLLIAVVEFGLFSMAYHEQKSQLLELKSELNIEAQQEVSVSDDNQAKSSTLSAVDIEKRMKKFSRKLFFITLSSALFIIFGVMTIFYFISKEFFDPRSMIDLESTYLESKEKNPKTQMIHAAKLSGIGEFSSTIAHDLKNPLTMIMANLDILFLKNKKGVLKLEDALVHVDRIKFSANRIKRLVNHMNRISRDDFDLSQKIRINDVFEDSLIILESRIKSNEVEIRNTLPKDLCEIQADANSLEQVIMNLIANSIDAIEHSPEKWVEISGKNYDECIKIYITDSGPGIPNKILEQIFSPFFTSKEEGKGTGLGLSICQKIINAHNGIINVSNSAEAGAQFTITLPKTHSQEHQDKMAS